MSGANGGFGYGREWLASVVVVGRRCLDSQLRPVSDGGPCCVQGPVAARFRQGRVRVVDSIHPVVYCSGQFRTCALFFRRGRPCRLLPQVDPPGCREQGSLLDGSHSGWRSSAYGRGVELKEPHVIGWHAIGSEVWHSYRSCGHIWPNIGQDSLEPCTAAMVGSYRLRLCLHCASRAA